MSTDLAYLIFGSTLVLALAAIVVHYYARKRKSHVEAAKYKMLEDDDHA